MLKTSGKDPSIIKVQIKCPVCDSEMISTIDTQKWKESMVETSICKDPNC
ncbi:MAG: hypothetical protein ACTSRZ_08290 [Promethearchaeota archaeon]